MAAGAAVVAADLPAFARVLDDGRLGVLFPNGDAQGLADAVGGLLDDPDRRAALVRGRVDGRVALRLVARRRPAGGGLRDGGRRSTPKPLAALTPPRGPR